MPLKSETNNNNYLKDIKNILLSAKEFAYSSVNSAMVQAYWLIGRRIVLEEQNGKNRAEYGKGIIKNISTELSSEFGSEVAPRRIREYRQFYLEFSANYGLNEKWHSLSAEFQLIGNHGKKKFLNYNSKNNFSTYQTCH